jgi:hypothetical protein
MSARLTENGSGLFQRLGNTPENGAEMKTALKKN